MDFSPFPAKFNRATMVLCKGKSYLKTLSSAFSLYILHHHEYYNGKGYPSGLKGENIPLGGRVITILDCFDAMTGDHPYRQAMSQEGAVEELKPCSGTQFDPMLVSLFSEYILFSSR
jgi:HD-GYP domain-containing protein (c-di-GMP phosphodiesterase class II)